MKAILCRELGGADRLVIEEMPDPVPGVGEVVIDVKAAALNFPDTLIISGKYQFKPDLPFSPGGEAAGVVSAVGANVEGVAEGDRVIATSLWGAFAEKMLVPVDRLLPMPDRMSDTIAASISITYGTSYYALRRRADLQPGETLLVLGAAGGVGLTAVELGKCFGARVIAAASSDEKLDAACEVGADERINYTKEPLKEKAKALTGGKGVDVVCDPVGGGFSEQAFRAMTWDGRHLVIGFASGEIPRLPLNLPLLKGASIVGVFWGAWTKSYPQQWRQDFAGLSEMFIDGRLKPNVSQVYDFENYHEAFECLTQRRATGKVVLNVRSA